MSVNTMTFVLHNELMKSVKSVTQSKYYREYFTSDNEANGVENATQNTFAKLTWIFVF
jgi:hypothetical protein